MPTEYTISLDRAACDGIFACLVHDDRFVEAADGLAAIDDAADIDATQHATDRDDVDSSTPMTAAFEDDRLENARQAARACPVDAIEVVTEGDDD